jgi:hypothetical protein
MCEISGSKTGGTGPAKVIPIRELPIKRIKRREAETKKKRREVYHLPVVVEVLAEGKCYYM